MDMTKGKIFYQEQLAYLLNNDAEGLVGNHYDVNAQLIRFDRVVTGHEALTVFFKEYIKSLTNFKLISTDHFQETEDTLFFEATASSDELGVVRVYDAFVIKNNKITHHFTGLKD